MSNETQEKNNLSQRIDEVFAAAGQVLANMQMGERLSRQEFHDKVCLQITNMPRATVNVMLTMFLKNSKEATLEVGRNGGVYKGGPPMRRMDRRPRCETCNQVLRKPEICQ